MPARSSIHHWYDAYVVARFAVLQKGLRGPPGRQLVIGQGATIVGNLLAQGNVFLSKSAIVRGNISSTHDVIIGSLAKVEGTVQTQGNVLLLEDAVVSGDVVAAGRIRIIGARVQGRVQAGGDVEVRGESMAANIQAGGRVLALPPPEALP